jgi:hypothetical protein
MITREFPLSVAAIHNRTDILKLLLAEGVDVNQRSTDTGGTALHCACVHGHPEVVRSLLQWEGCDVNQQMNDNGATALCCACASPTARQNSEVVKLLLAHPNIDVNRATTDTNETPLLGACAQGNTAIVRALLFNGAAAVINLADLEFGFTPLHVAAVSGNLATSQLLTVFGADATATTIANPFDLVDGGRETPLRLATVAEEPLLVEWLGAVVGWPPLRVAAGCRLHREVVAQLKRGLIDPDTLLWSDVELMRGTAAAPPTTLQWGDAPAVCPITVKLIKAITRGWAPARHWWHHANVRTAVYTLLQVGERLHGRSLTQAEHSTKMCGRSAPAAAAVVLPILPPEMWMAVMGFFLRRHWSV